MTRLHSETPTFRQSLWFEFRASGLRLLRFLSEINRRPPKHVPSDAPKEGSPVELILPLHSAEGAEKSLTLGKIENLRIALASLDGIKIPAGQTFSFWRQLGRPTRRKGYVEGRELREGCLIPSIGGGLCQLSNALFQLALKTGCEILERHAHSEVVPGSAAEKGMDATVFWNYVDLRFRPQHDLYLTAHMTASDLVLRAYTVGEGVSHVPVVVRPSRTVDNCMSCGVTGCFRHRKQSPSRESYGFLVDECWPEYNRLLHEEGRCDDFVAVPMNSAGLGSRYSWGDLARFKVEAFPMFAAVRSWRSRRLSSYGAARLDAQISFSRELATRMRKSLPFGCEHIFVAQTLLPFLWENRALQGRRFSVLMTRLPLREMHRRLDAALNSHPERLTLGEFRAPQRLVELEAEALEHAQEIISPHTEVLNLAGARARALEWEMPKPTSVPSFPAEKLVFAGPTAARKGCYELREALSILGQRVVPLGAQLESADFWEGYRTPQATVDARSIVVQPALIDDSPRALLKAIARGAKVICTPHCGLPDSLGVTLVPFGDVPQLVEAMRSAMAQFDRDRAPQNTPALSD
jgi:hypothetical protein